MDIEAFFGLLFGGVICGIVNVMGGGGSLIALPILLALGLPAGVSNGTNRISIIFQDLSSLRSFRKNKALPTGEIKKVAAPTIIGALLGAWSATYTLTENMLNIIILVLVAFMIYLLVVERKKWDSALPRSSSYHMDIWQFLLFVAIGFYGGFIQAGFTYLVMSVFVLVIGKNMEQADAAKLFLNLLITPFALILFIWHGQVNWLYGIVMGIGGWVGGWLGVKLVMRWSASFIRIVLIILLVLTAGYVLIFRMS